MDDSIVLSIVLVVLYRCGEDLKMLFSTPAVQHFMNSTPLHKLHCNKTIYQPGTLKKVSEIILFIIVCYINFVNQKVPQAIPFSAVTLDLPDVQGGVVTVTNLSLQQPPFDIHWSNLKHDDLVHVFHGVIGQNRELVHTGDFVMLTSVHHEEVCTFILIMLKEGYYSIPIYTLRTSTCLL